MDKVVAQYEQNRLKDSTVIEVQKLQIFDLQQTVDASKNNDSQLQLVIAGQSKTIESLKGNESSCCKLVEHLESTDNIRYFVKAPLSKWYTEVFEKPKFIK
jgi:septal ring factor EnvC (AmiA/AmiB activator)